MGVVSSFSVRSHRVFAFHTIFFFYSNYSRTDGGSGGGGLCTTENHGTRFLSEATLVKGG